MRKVLIILAAGIFLAAAVSSVYAVQTFEITTELRIYDPAKAYNGYTLFEPSRGDTVYLIDMEGNVVHTWPAVSNPKILENGNLWGSMIEIDWNGNTVWEWEAPPDRSPHHDTWKIFNPKLGKETALALIRVGDLTNAEIYAAGGDPGIDYEATNRNSRLDGLVEVDIESGEIIWEWKFHDHTIQDRNALWPNHVGGLTIADFPGKADVFWKTDQSTKNSADEGIVRDWHHCNSIDYNEDLDVIAINAKHWSEFYVIDHGNTFIAADPAGSIALAAGPAGDYIYRFGNPSAYQQGDPPSFNQEGHQQMYGSHNIQWIKEAHYTGGPALPGAGNFLIYSNGNYHPRGYKSEVLEINPYIDASGLPTDPPVYINPPVADYDGSTSNQVVSLYASVDQSSFYSSYISSCQRLPNGNTLIDAGYHGHFFEVTLDGDVVWEYINPVLARANPPRISTTLRDSDGRNASVFRAYRYGPDYPGLAGKDLTPLGPITESTVEGALDKFRESQAGFAGGVGGDPGYDPY